jgi:hypothetical protein
MDRTGSRKACVTRGMIDMLLLAIKLARQRATNSAAKKLPSAPRPRVIQALGGTHAGPPAHRWAPARQIIPSRRLPGPPYRTRRKVDGQRRPATATVGKVLSTPPFGIPRDQVNSRVPAFHQGSMSCASARRRARRGYRARSHRPGPSGRCCTGGEHLRAGCVSLQSR